ncbi:hypothetical protein SE17_15330 [Kouleothrix aurantiaca]|uniref:Short-chain dehydrogenase n=1 Tax=Kouleothrix aurantiaca TaxID=186479 RepID=A0A0P9D384_9CHLR|nr:hypothetical protein SE17_15330 [Kouleothrix aurantiaca]
MQQGTLAGQVALVTGSGRGLGRAIAARLAELGVAVAVLSSLVGLGMAVGCWACTTWPQAERARLRTAISASMAKRAERVADAMRDIIGKLLCPVFMLFHRRHTYSRKPCEKVTGEFCAF